MFRGDGLKEPQAAKCRLRSLSAVNPFGRSSPCCRSIRTGAILLSGPLGSLFGLYSSFLTGPSLELIRVGPRGGLSWSPIHEHTNRNLP